MGAHICEYIKNKWIVYFERVNIMYVNYISIFLAREKKDKPGTNKLVFQEWKGYDKKRKTEASLTWILTGQTGDNLNMKTDENNGF